MANFKSFKIIFTVISILVCGFLFCESVCADENSIDSETVKYSKIYDELQLPDFEYLFGIDPFQTEEYTKYMYTPYPLLRSGVRFVFKDVVIDPGYYLLTPRTKDGKDYVLFKTSGRVKYVIPVYDRGVVSPSFYSKYIQQPKRTWWEKVCRGTTNTIGRVLKKQTKRTPPPKAYIEVNEIGGEFWQMILYYGTQKYYMIFKK